MAQGNLSACLPVTLAYEGGLSMIRSDPGNWTGGKVDVGELKGTNFGIAASSHPTLDIVHLTKADAAAIYQREYWTPAGCETLPAGLDLSHFDGTVNSGRGRSAKWLETALEATTAGARVQGYASARLASLHAFATWATFGKGWSTRVAGVEAKALAMIVGPEAAPAVIAAAGAKAATKAKVAGAAAHAGTAVAAGGLAVATTGHPVLGAAVTIAAVLSALWSAFHASTSGARAATLAAHATAG